MISDTCLEENVDISYYPVDINLTPIFSHIEDPEDYVYFINYYGQYSNYEIRAFSKKYSNLIVDNVQAFYTPSIKGLDTIYTCRKIFFEYQMEHIYILIAFLQNQFHMTNHTIDLLF